MKSTTKTTPNKKGSKKTMTKKTMTKKRITKKEVVKKTVAKKVIAKKVIAKKAGVKKSSIAKKVVAKKVVVKKIAGKKIVATKKLPSKKLLVKKTPAKKAVEKKAVEKKMATKKKSGEKLSMKENTSEKLDQTQAVSLVAGEMAPEFSLKDQNEREISLKDFRGKKVLIYFYPRAMTPGCTVQACSLRDSESALQDEGIITLGISPDVVKKLKQFEQKENLNFTLLSDPDHLVSKAYGSWGLKKFMGREYMGILRQSYLIDGEGKIIHVMTKVDTKNHHEEILKIFKAASTSN